MPARDNCGARLERPCTGANRYGCIGTNIESPIGILPIRPPEGMGEEHDKIAPLSTG